MNTFMSVAIGMVTGIIIGIAASFKAAEKKYSEKAEEEIANAEHDIREYYAQKHGCCGKCQGKEDATVDDCELGEGIQEAGFDNEETTDPVMAKQYHDISGAYQPSKKPYVLEDKLPDFIENHPHLDGFAELLAVYDRDRGRVADEDGNEILDVKGVLGWNNLNRLYTDEEFARDNTITIVCERDGMIYRVHAGDLSEFMEDLDDESDIY